ncbi:MAG: DUF853 family protein [Deltaproteobacteria bacterium]|nr:DUF853 family protein [Deltaproteobacteria bacterium]
MARTPWPIGAQRPLDGAGALTSFALRPEDLRTHGVVLGMTGSGKTGLLMVLMEEAVRAGVPLLVLDVKGDMANLGLACDRPGPQGFVPWLDPTDLESPDNTVTPTVDSVAQALDSQRTRGLIPWSLSPADCAALNDSLALRVLTPGARHGSPLHLLSGLERPSTRWSTDPDAAQSALASALSMVLRRLRLDSDPTSSRAHVLLSAFATRRHQAGEPCRLEDLVQDLEAPPIEELGALSVDEFVSKPQRAELAASLNTLLASPSFAVWREGCALDVGQWLAKRSDGRTPVTLVSVAHLDDDDRAAVLGLVLDDTLSWVRTLSGTTALRALVVFDEVYGYLPPHPANPPTRKPLVSLMKQGRAFGVGVLLATQNPMDLDYRALSNAGLWFVGRLQTDADRERVVEAIAPSTPRRARPKARGGGRDPSPEASVAPTLADRVKSLASRWFVLHTAREGEGRGLGLLRPREALSWLKGPLTLRELARRNGAG